MFLIYLSYTQRSVEHGNMTRCAFPTFLGGWDLNLNLNRQKKFANFLFAGFSLSRLLKMEEFHSFAWIWP